MEARDLYRMNVTKLQEEAMEIPDIQGVTAMKKKELIKLLAKTHGIAMKAPGESAEGMKVLKKRIRTLKAKRDEALANKDREALAGIRQGIRTLKRHTRYLARAMKQRESAAAASSPEPTAAPTGPASA